MITERVRSAHVVQRAAEWLSNADNAAQLSGHLADLAVGLADLVNDDDVHRLVDEELARAVERLPLASLAGRGLEMMTAENRHHELFDAILRGLERFLDDSRETLRARFAQEAPWWLPDAVDDRIFDRLFDGVCRLLRDVNSNSDHSSEQEEYGLQRRYDYSLGRTRCRAQAPGHVYRLDRRIRSASLGLRGCR